MTAKRNISELIQQDDMELLQQDGGVLDKISESLKQYDEIALVPQDDVETPKGIKVPEPTPVFHNYYRIQHRPDRPADHRVKVMVSREIYDKVRHCRNCEMGGIVKTSIGREIFCYAVRGAALPSRLVEKCPNGEF